MRPSFPDSVPSEALGSGDAAGEQLLGESLELLQRQLVKDGLDAAGDALLAKTPSSP